MSDTDNGNNPECRYHGYLGSVCGSYPEKYARNRLDKPDPGKWRSDRESVILGRTTAGRLKMAGYKMCLSDKVDISQRWAGVGYPTFALRQKYHLLTQRLTLAVSQLTYYTQTDV